MSESTNDQYPLTFICRKTREEFKGRMLISGSCGVIFDHHKKEATTYSLHFLRKAFKSSKDNRYKNKPDHIKPVVGVKRKSKKFLQYLNGEDNSVPTYDQFEELEA